MSFKQRVIGFGVMAAVSCFIGGIGLYFLFTSKYIEFGVFYTIASICTMVSTLFFVGPKKQLKRMIKPHRAIATGIWVLSMVLTIVFASLAIPAAVLISVILQFLAFLWYSLSYAPFARRIVKKVFSSICPCIKTATAE
uniref:Vesicle transport protein n=1 Tax=Arcella intermedia TaxID=1963864 RepID=A0A6B2LMZ2_9EUKA